MSERWNLYLVFFLKINRSKTSKYLIVRFIQIFDQTCDPTSINIWTLPVCVDFTARHCSISGLSLQPAKWGGKTRTRSRCLKLLERLVLSLGKGKVLKLLALLLICLYKCTGQCVKNDLKSKLELNVLLKSKRSLQTKPIHQT